MTEVLVTGKWAVNEGAWFVTLGTAAGKTMPATWRTGYMCSWGDVPTADSYEIWGKAFGPEDAEFYFTEHGASVTVDGVRYQRGLPARPADGSIWDIEPESWLE